jgi:tetrahydromethanopterin S-methyltransferase subunit C
MSATSAASWGATSSRRCAGWGTGCGPDRPPAADG